MNTESLRAYIESTVGPVRASEPRKWRMGEELSAHLVESFEEERRRLGDDHAAAERAIQRLGDPKELTRSLEASVPWLERLLYSRIPAPQTLEVWDRAWTRRNDESAARYATRTTLWMLMLIAVGEVLGILASTAVQTRALEWPVILAWSTAALVTYGAGAFIFPLLCEGMVRAIMTGPSRWGRPMLYALVGALTVIALELCFDQISWAGVPRKSFFPRPDWPRLLVEALLAAIILAGSAQASVTRRRSRDGWGLSELSV